MYLIFDYLFLFANFYEIAFQENNFYLAESPKSILKLKRKLLKLSKNLEFFSKKFKKMEKYFAHILKDGIIILQVHGGSTITSREKT